MFCNYFTEYKGRNTHHNIKQVTHSANPPTISIDLSSLHVADERPQCAPLHHRGNNKKFIGIMKVWQYSYTSKTVTIRSLMFHTTGFSETIHFKLNKVDLMCFLLSTFYVRERIKAKLLFLFKTF